MPAISLTHIALYGELPESLLLLLLLKPSDASSLTGVTHMVHLRCAGQSESTSDNGMWRVHQNQMLFSTTMIITIQYRPRGQYDY
jgi:hypothetical protein